MRSTNKIYDRQIGRNAQLFAESLSNYETKETRYPYIRILVSIIEQAHPEWNQAPTKDSQIAHLAMMLSGGILDTIEVAEIVRVRDEERGLIPPQIPAKSAEAKEEPVEAKEDENTPEVETKSEESSEVNSDEISSEDAETIEEDESKGDSSDDTDEEEGDEEEPSSDDEPTSDEESPEEDDDQEEAKEEK